MLRFSFLTLFPSLIEGYFQDSILKRAIEAGIFQVEICNFRHFSDNKYLKVDEYQIGGGAGLIIDPTPIGKAIASIKRTHADSHIIFVQPVGKPFRSNDAKRLALKSHITLVCGRYEGIDERAIEEYASEVFSVGDFILTGGELAALMICDATTRHLKGTLGNMESLCNESYEQGLLEAPQFSRTKTHTFYPPPSEYSKGNHAKILTLKNQMSVARTKYYRPDLYQSYKIK